jgi:hypothetical protein
MAQLVNNFKIYYKISINIDIELFSNNILLKRFFVVEKLSNC